MVEIMRKKQTRFDVIASSYEKALSLYPNARTDAEEVLKLLDVKDDETVLETTAGTGYLTMQLSRLLRTGTVISHDISPVMMNFAKKKIKDAEITNVEFYLERSGLFPEIKDESVDKAVCFGGFHHVEEPIKMFRTVQRILKPGGIFVVGDFADDSPVQKYFDEEINILTDTGHQGLFLSKSQMVNFARFAKLEVVSVERKVAPFLFSSKKDVGIFFQLVHALKQTSEEAQRDIEKYMGIKKNKEGFFVPMDYIYAKYRKRG